MKLTNRMKKILLFLLHPREGSRWFEEARRHVPEAYCSDRWIIASFCERKSDFDFTHSERESYRRTFRILEKHGLLSRIPEYWASYTLTSKGKETAEEIEEELKGLAREFEYLI